MLGWNEVGALVGSLLYSHSTSDAEWKARRHRSRVIGHGYRLYKSGNQSATVILEGASVLSVGLTEGPDMSRHV